MAIMPTSKVRLLSNVPLHDYNHSVLYSDSTAQYNDFISYLKYNVGDDFTFVRDSGAIKVALPIGQCYELNYMMFQNASYSNKWFYAFITSVEYINDETTMLYFTVDDVQSWQFQVSIEESFVEREHVMDDTIGAHTVPEGLETGPYMTIGSPTELLGGYALETYIAVSDLPPGYAESSPVTWINPRAVSHLITSYYLADLGSARSQATGVNLNRTITWLSENAKLDAVICVFTVPTNLVSLTEEYEYKHLEFATRGQSTSFKNNKLLTYPYCACVVESPGQALELRYELFGENCRLDTVGIFGPGPKISGYVVNYMGNQRDYEHVLSLKDFPILPYRATMFENWWAMNRAQIVTGVAKDVVATAIGGVATNNVLSSEILGLKNANKNMLQGQDPVLRLARSRNNTQVKINQAKIDNMDLNIGGSIASNVVGALGDIYQHSLVPDQMVGSANCGDIFSTIGDNGFRSYCRGLRPEYVRIIDNYFEHFGYKVNSMKVPNINGRPHWNYVKTIGANVHGTAPSNAVDTFRDVLNNGITFWKALGEVENYSLNNH